MRYAHSLTIATFLALGSIVPAAAEGDAAKGEQVYNQCRACHSLEPGQHRLGPSLADIWGREAGSVESFNRYSKALKQSDIVWDAETLDKYLADTRGYIPGNKMTYPGVRDSEKRANLIAFLKSQSE